MGLPGSSEWSLDDPSDGGLAAVAAPKPAAWFGVGADVGSRFRCSSLPFLPSAMKLPTTTWKTECNRAKENASLGHKPAENKVIAANR